MCKLREMGYNLIVDSVGKLFRDISPNTVYISVFCFLLFLTGGCTGALWGEGKNIYLTDEQIDEALLNNPSKYRQIASDAGVVWVAARAVKLGMNEAVAGLLHDEPRLAVAHERNGYTLLHLAQDVEIAKILVNAGADVNEANNLGKETVLHVSVWRPACLSVVRFLLRNGANPNLPDHKGRTALFSAVLTPNTDAEVVAELLHAGANPNHADQWGNTPLHLVRDAVCASVLLRSGASPNSRNEDSETPLHTAVWRSYDIVQLLLKNGADINAQDAKGETALDKAITSGNQEMVEFLIAHEGKSRKAKKLIRPGKWLI